ncbi:hypothetical protein D3C77_632180 [compost metagenome]
MGVDHVQQQIGIAGFLQRRAKRLDQLVRQVTNETHRIRQDHRSDIRQLQAPQRRIQRGEQLVGRVDVGFRERVEQRGLAGVGVTDQRD